MIRRSVDNGNFQIVYLRESLNEEGNTLVYDNESGDDLQFIHNAIHDSKIEIKGIDNHLNELLAISVNAKASGNDVIYRLRSYFNILSMG